MALHEFTSLGELEVAQALHLFKRTAHRDWQKAGLLLMASLR